MPAEGRDDMNAVLLIKIVAIIALIGLLLYLRKKE
ncbi:MAG: LPXTG cell wall anchor domain-containing protein [Candidatus Omnitrophica bacterium]|nr:LPXTG cell wall anchor domain-containing protein [Candidatus Omnitrophota bacterium]